MKCYVIQDNNKTRFYVDFCCLDVVQRERQNDALPVQDDEASVTSGQPDSLNLFTFAGYEILDK